MFVSSAGSRTVKRLHTSGIFLAEQASERILACLPASNNSIECRFFPPETRENKKNVECVDEIHVNSFAKLLASDVTDMYVGSMAKSKQALLTESRKKPQLALSGRFCCQIDIDDVRHSYTNNSLLSIVGENRRA